MRLSRLKFTALAVLLGTSLQVHATSVTLFGTDVKFTFDNTSLFGSANVVGNSLFFLPTNFKAESLNGAGTVTASDTLIIDVVATTPGYDLTSFSMLEQGDYSRNGIDASVAASGRLGVTSTTKTCSLFACSDAGLFNVASLGDTSGLKQAWSGGTSVDLANTSGWNTDTAVQISFQNNLSATTLNNGEQAFIQKKSGAIGLVVNPVPVPAAVWLFASGLLGLVSVSRRRFSH